MECINIKQESECCCCFNKEDLFNMLEPYNFGEKIEIYSVMIAECFQIDFNSIIEESKRNLYLICMNCVLRLRDAIMLRSQVQIAHDRLQGERCKNDNNESLSERSDNAENMQSHVPEFVEYHYKVEKEEYAPMECSDVSVTKKEYDNMECEASVDSNAPFSNKNPFELKPLKIVIEKLDNRMENITVISTKENANDAKSPHSYMFLCNLCNKLFRTFFVIRNHIKYHPAIKKSFSCDYCDKSYTRKHNLRSHIRGHMNIKNYVCNVCGKAYSIWDSLNSHMSRHSNLKLNCEFCGKAFTLNSQLGRHMKIHQQKDIACTYCDKIFYSKSSLAEHIKIHKEFVCDLCTKVFKRRKRLEDHIMTHVGMHTTQCEICKEKFVSNFALKKHTQARHVTNLCELKKYFTCNICGKILCSKQTFKNHILIHSGIKYQCDICEKAFVSKTKLLRHKRVHSDPQNFTCKYCNKIFSDTDTLSRHEKIHLNIKDFICEFCKKGFRCRFSLNRHMSVHTRL